MRRRTAVALAAAAVALGLWAAFRHVRPQPEPFAIDESLPAGAVRRIGSRMFGRVGGPNRRLVELSPDGARIYVCDDDGLLRAWDADRGAPLWQVAAHADAVPPSSGALDRRLERMWRAWSGTWHAPPRDLAVSPDGRRIATCAAAMIRVFDAETGRCVAERRTEREVDDLAWTPDGRRLLRADKDRIAAWDVDEDAEAFSEPFASEYLDFAPRRDGAVAVRLESDAASPVTLLDGTTLARAGEIPKPPEKWYPTLEFDRDGRELVARWPDAAQRRWTWAWFDPATGALGESFQTDGFVARILEPRRGRQLVVVAGPSALEILGLDSGTTMRLAAAGAAPAIAPLAPDRRRIAWAALGRARIHDLDEGRRLHADELLVDPESFVVLPGGERLHAASDDAALVEIEIATGRVLRRFDIGGELQEGPLVSQDGRYVAGRSGRGMFRVDRTDGRTDLWPRWSPYFAFRGAELIGLGWRDQQLCVLDVASGAETALEHGLSTSVGDVVFSPDGTRLRADLKVGTWVWDTATGRAVDEPLRGPPRLRLADADEGGGQQILWGGSEREPLALQDPLDVAGTPPALLAEGQTPRGTRVVAVPQNPTGARARRTRDARIVLVAADDGRTVATLTAHDGPIVRLAFAEGGRHLLSGHEDGTIVVWDLGALPAR